MYFIPLIRILINLNTIIAPILLMVFIWVFIKKKRKAVIIVLGLLITSVVILYLTQLKPHCEYNGDTFLVEDYRGMSQQEIQSQGGAGCSYAVKKGQGMTFTAPILNIPCGNTENVCGQMVTCECLFGDYRIVPF